MTQDDDEILDPKWWRDIIGQQEDRSLSRLALRLEEACTSASDVQAKAVLSVLARVTSPMLQPTNWNEPFGEQ